jgi:type I restriction enzyme S subunit
MNNILLDSLPIWTTAQAQKTSNRGISASNQQLLGIQKMRELILELAIRGKLVLQDPNDEPASELLKRIGAEKRKLVKDKKIRKQETFKEIDKNDIPFKLPIGWEWTYLGEIGNIFNGNSISSTVKEEKYTNLKEGLPFIATKDVNYGWQALDYNNGILVPKNEKGFNVAHKGAVFICAEGGSAGKKCGITNQDVCFGNKLFAIELYGSIISKYVLSYYLCPTFFSSFSESMTGIIGGIGLSKFIQLQFPLPPLAEQHRIVERVNELMALCDELEKEQTNSNTAHETLVEVLLSTLTAAKNLDDFKEVWQCVAACFDTLFTSEHSIDRLKQTILQLAVMGKLAPQDPNDESASELLRKIDKEKARLVKEGKIKIEKNLPPITDEELHYQLPNNWIWCRMQDLCPNISSGSTPENRFFIDSGIPYLKVYNIRNQKIDFSFKEQFVSQDINSTKLKRSILNPGDVIMNIVGPPLGKVAIIPDDYDEWNCNQAIVFFKPVIKKFNQWLYTFLCTGTFLNDIELIGTAGQDNISVTKSKNIVIPLPPLQEQLRIVSKVEELFALCDSLKEGIHKAQEIQNVLAEEIVRRVVN